MEVILWETILEQKLQNRNVYKTMKRKVYKIDKRHIYLYTMLTRFLIQ